MSGAGVGTGANDLAALRKVLRPIEHEAKVQPWADKRPWRVTTHTVVEGGVVVVDLHDLGAGLAKAAVRAVLDAEPPEAGAVVFVHGVGRHSTGPAVLHKVVRQALGEAGAKMRAVGNARMAWIADPGRAPGWVTGAWGWGTWAWMAALGLAVAAGLGHALGLW